MRISATDTHTHTGSTLVVAGTAFAVWCHTMPAMTQHWENHVVLVGRVSTTAQDIDLPSGEVLTRLRVVVPRTRPTTRTTVDTIDLVCLKAAVRRRAHSLEIGDVVRVSGALRRRFWKAGAAVASRVDVEVVALTRE